MSSVHRIARLRPAASTAADPARVAGGQGGFTYLGLLLAMVLLGAGLSLTGTVWHTQQQREKEKELLFIGNQFREAIGQYYERSPGGAKAYPRRLEDLLKDPRQITTQRYLRRLYRDPLTGQAKWGLVKEPSGGIIGVYSLSTDKPLKTGNFRAADRGLAGKDKYSEWWFVYAPKQPAVPPFFPPPGG